MAAKEISRSFEADRGAVVVTLQDDLGNRSLHTLHISHDHELCPGCGHRLVRDAGGDVDVDAEVKSLLAETDARTAKLAVKFQKAGWKAPTSG